MIRIMNMIILCPFVISLVQAQTQSSGIWTELEEHGAKESDLKAFKSVMEKLRTEASKGRGALSHKQRRPEENEDLYQGDIILTAKQAKQLEKEHLASGDETIDLGRSAFIWQNFWQKKKIPYSIDRRSGVNEAGVEAGVKVWNELTCLSFYRDDNDRTSDRIEFFRGGGCWSHLGRTGGKQQISIGDGCEGVGVVTHEIGHALGLQHEQCRTDRDNHIILHPENINPQFLFSYDKHENVAYLRTIPYDYGSNMHYDRNGFANAGTKSFTVIDSTYTNTVGNRDGPSFFDAMAINRVYCSGICPNTTAYYRGYLHPKDCSKLVCPEGLGGDRCRYAKKTSKDIGPNTVKATSREKTFEISGTGTAYYFIKASRGRRVELTFTKIGFHCVESCYYGYVGVQWKDLANSPAKICCMEHNKFVSEKNALLLQYRSGGTNANIQFKFKEI